MLRIDRSTGQIPSDYDDNYLELVRLLIEGAGLEHSLMIAYLFALFSVKRQYTRVRGDITRLSYLEHSPIGRGGTEVLRQHDTFLDVALEEMQHLALVNWFLVELAAAPNLCPHAFPFVSDLYPFEIHLRSLDRYTAATYLWVESDSCKLNLSERCRGLSEPENFIREVRQVLHDGSQRYRELSVDNEPINHVGSLYRKIVCQTRRVAEHPPAFLPSHFPWAEWEDRMSWILYQGELSHYDFFKGVFTGDAFIPDDHVWDDPEAEIYPAYSFKRLTAYTHHPDTIPNEAARKIAWLADLHYWIILCLLDTAYRAGERKFCYKAIDNMTLGLWHLGCHLAEHYKTGLPFDPVGPGYCLGRTPRMSLHILRLLVLEAQGKANELAERHQLPATYDPQLLALTLRGLEQLSSRAWPLPDETEFRFA
ncbi:MAG TPA: ferritin-like domain-containing protein [Gemmataceae bacterium]|nr:ferritin-like domain-containing protein [Gemmataceae bacterium]